MAKYSDRTKQDAPDYKVGDLVMLDARNIKTKHPTHKLAPKSYGPFPITRVGTRSCTLDLGDQWNIFPTFHVSLLEPYRHSTCPERRQSPPPPDEIEGEIEYEVEHIVRSEERQKRRKVRGRYQVYSEVYYLIKWKGYSHDENTWQPASSMTNTAELVAQFHATNPEMPGLR